MQLIITASFMVILQAGTVVQAAGLSTAVAISEGQGLSAVSPQSTSPVSGPPASAQQAPSSERSSNPDCNGTVQTAGSVTALLSRLARSAEVARGVQCPIPEVPEKSASEELHP